MDQQVHRGLAQSQEFLAQFQAGIPWERVLLVCHPASFQKSGAEAWFQSMTDSAPPRFVDFSSNPKSAEVERGVAQFSAARAEALIAIGGGSILDMAKLINFFGSCNLGVDAYLDQARPSSASLRPLLAVPTTAGSGSEATHFAVIYRGKAKYSVAAPAIRPSHVLLAPEFTWSLPAYPTACTGLDALAQAIESHWARKATEESRRYARQALGLAWDHLAAAVNAPAPEHRAAMLEAAHGAGRAIDVTQTTGAHAFSYALTTEFGLPHGQAVALLLPFFIAYHARMGIQVETVNAERVRALVHEVGLDRKLPATSGEIHGLLTRHVNLERLSNNPVPVPDDLVREIAQGLAGR